MHYHHIQIKRFIVSYIILFGFVGSLVITVFSYFFGLTFIQKNYTNNYVQTTFDIFDHDMENLVKQNNLIIFDIASNKSLRQIFLDTGMTIVEKRHKVQCLLEDFLAGYSEIRQIDILSSAAVRYTYVAPLFDRESPLPLPSDAYISGFTNRSLNLYDHCILDQTGNPCLILGRNTDIGAVILYLNEFAVSGLYQSSALKNSTIFLSNNERIISCSDPDYIGAAAALPLKESSPTLYTHLVELSALGENLELVYIPSEQDLIQVSGRLNRILFVTLFGTVFVCLFLVLLVSRQLFRSINTLRKNLRNFSDDYNFVFKVNPHSELAQLEEQFLTMCNQIRTLITDIAREKDETRIAELKALQSQINPHFIYNSIDSISWMAKLKKPYKDIERLSYYLGLFFRLGLHKGHSMITVAEELQHVNSYLEIEKIRFPELFDVEISVTPEVAELKIIKIILQPLVENAIHHGFAGIDYKGKISIKGFLSPTEPEFVVFQVADNGVGIELTEGSLPTSNHKDGGYALRNINERLCLEYGPAAGLTFESRPNQGTVVSFRIERQRML